MCDLIWNSLRGVTIELFFFCKFPDIKEKLDELHDKQMEEAHRLGEIRSAFANLKKEEEPRDERYKRTCKQLKELKKRISPEALEKPEVINRIIIDSKRMS